ncbi:hypothetical protein CCP3SC15_1240003 [Gammaproteobacteria bacterium]
MLRARLDGRAVPEDTVDGVLRPRAVRGVDAEDTDVQLDGNPLVAGFQQLRQHVRRCLKQVKPLLVLVLVVDESEVDDPRRTKPSVELVNVLQLALARISHDTLYDLSHFRTSTFPSRYAAIPSDLSLGTPMASRMVAIGAPPPC